MGNFTFSFDKPLTAGTSENVGNFPKLGHAYKAEIISVGENESGTMIYVEVKGIDYTDGTYNHSFAFSRNSPYVVDDIEKLCKNVIASNEKMQGAAGNKSMDISKWTGQGLRIGVVFKAKDENDGNGNWAPGKWLTIDRSITIDRVDEFVPDMDAYNAHQAKFWGDSTAPSKVEEKPVEPTGQEPAEDELPW